MNVVIWGIGKEFRELYNLLKLHDRRRLTISLR